ncbi:MAG TPA: hypothetical protein VMU68_13060 [Acidimicrobiales bacterium]|nr:hypothetical protein [Acidimicrobiales bacterium]
MNSLIPVASFRPWIRSLAIVVVVAMAVGGSLTLAQSTSHAAASAGIGFQVPQLVVRAGTSNVIYVLYSATCGGTRCYRLTRSANGGQTFAKVTAPPISSEYTNASSVTGSLDQLVFANPEDGYATENFWGTQSTLYATFDGAHSWHQEHIKGAEFIQSLTSSPTAFYVITEHCDPRHTTCTNLQLARTPLQRSAWTSTPVPENVLRGGTPSFGLQVAAYGSKTWILEQAKYPPQRLATSTNGGKSFSIKPEPGLTGAATCQLTATSMTSLWATCAQGNELSELLYSDDGGVHWNGTSEYSKGTVGRLLSFGSFDPISRDVAYATDGFDTTATQTIYQVTGSSDAFRVVGSLPTSKYLYDLTFTNSKQGLAYAFVGQGAAHPLWSTDNGGRSWRQVPVPTT